MNQLRGVIIILHPWINIKAKLHFSWAKPRGGIIQFPRATPYGSTQGSTVYKLTTIDWGCWDWMLPKLFFQNCWFINLETDWHIQHNQRGMSSGKFRWREMRGKAQRILSSSFELHNIQAEQFEFRREPFRWQSQIQCDQVSVEKQRDPFENGSRMHAEEWWLFCVRHVFRTAWSEWQLFKVSSDLRIPSHITRKLIDSGFLSSGYGIRASNKTANNFTMQPMQKNSILSTKIAQAVMESLNETAFMQNEEMATNVNNFVYFSVNNNSIACRTVGASTYSRIDLNQKFDTIPNWSSLFGTIECLWNFKHARMDSISSVEFVTKVVWMIVRARFELWFDLQKVRFG